MSLKDIIEQQNRIYYTSIDKFELISARQALEPVITDRFISGDNKANAIGLSMRLEIKTIAITIIQDNLGIRDMSEHTSRLDAISASALELNFQKTSQLALRIKEFAEALSNLYSSCRKIRLTYVTPSGEIAPVDEESCLRAAEAYREWLPQCEGIPSAEMLFDKVRYLDPKAEIVELIESLIEEAEGVHRDMVNAHLAKTHDSAVISIPQEWETFEYRPGLTTEANDDRLKVICTPFRDEFLFLAFAHARKCGFRPVYLNVKEDTFASCSKEEMERIIESLKDGGNCFIITGLANYYAPNKATLIKVFHELSRSLSGLCVLMHDYTGARHLWFEVDQALNGAYDASYMYLSMPNYNETIELFRSVGMDVTFEEEFIKRHCAFMGFIGMNKAIIAHLNGRDWKGVAYDVSSKNASLTEGYFRELPSQSQLLDTGWGEHHTYANSIALQPKKPFDFDYDENNICNPENIRKIVEMENITMQERCGLMVRYCLLLGADVSTWQELSEEDKLTRITLATKSVGRLLSVQYDPIVELPPALDGKAGGYCSGGGKKIVYSRTCIDNYEWLSDAICHEMYHSFQHTAVDLGWRLWHQNEILVSQYRTEEWKSNFQSYIDINKHYKYYMLQTVEVDARIFAKETTVGASAKWSLINLI